MTNLWRNTNITYATPWGLKSHYLQYSAISVRGKRLAARGGGGSEMLEHIAENHSIKCLGIKRQSVPIHVMGI